MQRIQRYHLPLEANPKIDMPTAARVLNVASTQDRSDVIVMWAIVDIDRPGETRPREFRIASTGDDIPGYPRRFIGMVTVNYIRVHVFEV